MPLTRSAARKAQAQEAEGHRLEPSYPEKTIVMVSPSDTHTRPPSTVVKIEYDLNPSLQLSSPTSTSSIGTIDAGYITPAPQGSFDAGSVIKTPKRLMRQSERIGPYGIHKQYQVSKVFIAGNGQAAVSPMRVPRSQLHPLVGQEEGNSPSQSARFAWEENGRHHRLAPDGTILNIEGHSSPVQRKLANNSPGLGPEGTELLDVDGISPHPRVDQEENHGFLKHARLMSGANGRRSRFAPGTMFNIEGTSSPVRNKLVNNSPRLGPEGTELLDDVDGTSSRPRVFRTRHRKQLGPEGTEIIQ